MLVPFVVVADAEVIDELAEPGFSVFPMEMDELRLLLLLLWLLPNEAPLPDCAKDHGAIAKLNAKAVAHLPIQSRDKLF